VNRVLIFAPNWLGDAVMALPAIADVRRGLPQATIVVAARKSVAALFGMVRDIDEVIALDSPATSIGGDADAAILLPNSFHAAVVAARAGIPQRWGYRTDWRGMLLTRAIDRAPAGIHQIDYYRRLVRALGFPNGSDAPQLEVSAAIRAAAAHTLMQAGWDGQTPLVALAPGAAYGGAKRWPTESFAALARGLAGDGVRPVLVGSAADAPGGRAVESVLGDPTLVLNLIGKTDIPTLAGVLAAARALVANDSGALHLGAAIGTAVTAMFGPTDDRVTAPRPGHSSRSAAVVLTHTVWCRPCGLRECPLDHACMRGIGVEAVVDATMRAGGR
jgi:lipopolysaccharide heptosyltransferase II